MGFTAWPIDALPLLKEEKFEPPNFPHCTNFLIKTFHMGFPRDFPAPLTKASTEQPSQILGFPRIYYQNALK